MSLAKLLSKINEAKAVVGTDVDPSPSNTYAAREGRQRRAKEELNDLTSKYTQEMLRSSVFIIATGSESNIFAEAAEAEYNCFYMEANELFTDLADRVAPVLYEGKESGSNLFMTVGNHLEDLARDVGVIGYPQFLFTESYKRMITDKEDFTKLLAKAISEQVGSELVGAYALSKITPRAIAKNHEYRFTAVVLRTDDSELATSLTNSLTRLTPYVFNVVAGKNLKSYKTQEGFFKTKDAKKENVESTLKNISNMVKR